MRFFSQATLHTLPAFLLDMFSWVRFIMTHDATVYDLIFMISVKTTCSIYKTWSQNLPLKLGNLQVRGKRTFEALDTVNKMHKAQYLLQMWT